MFFLRNYSGHSFYLTNSQNWTHTHQINSFPVTIILYDCEIDFELFTTVTTVHSKKYT